ncbi:MFS transporter [Caulobacter flavus]|uniref:MFS transporter n=1 Tax=Caulobacter flavus TaxID=1679497 RepID=A0A2N5CKS0_9CAUL|nr:MFS transporter [Caulobacter flavus]AYV47196.1 MFS transporter [Caulobacter flavus]PLR06159.1 MFS transporter [Caulobacter flavus]
MTAATLAASPVRDAAQNARRLRRMSLALFLGGFSTFSLLYCVQPLLPTFARTFALSPAQSALALSLSTATLAIAILLAGGAAQRLNLKSLMFGSMALAAACNMAAALAPTWPLLLAARAAEGLLLGGVPAVAMTYLAEETEASDLAAAMGLYVAGTAFGGMAGRVGMGLLLAAFDWRMAMAAIGAVDLVAAVAFFALLPRPRHARTPAPERLSDRLRTWNEAWRRPGLLALFGLGFCLTGVFVALFNYVEFRLEGAPYRLSQTQVGLIFLVYAFGVWSSSTAGRLAQRYGRRRLLLVGLLVILAGIALTLPTSLASVIAGIALVTTGFFIAHAIASGWVGRLAGPAKSQSAALYLLFYYAGSSLAGAVGGWFWRHGAWPAVAGFTAMLAIAGVALALRIPREDPA